MTRVVQMSTTGGPEVLQPKAIELGEPGPDQLLIRQTAIGVNFHDVYVRSGQYPNVLSLPGIPGVEACGVVEAAGSGAGASFKPGDRIAYATPGYGAYSEARLLDARLAVRVPDGISDAAAASLMIKGTTAALLLFEVAAVQPGDLLLVHAAAGGVGRLLCQWARQLGAQVIGTVGSPAKFDAAFAGGCHHVLEYGAADFVPRVRELSNGLGVRVVFDSIGQTTMAGSFECLARCGHLVNFGQSSGPVEPFTMAQLSAKSATVSRPVVFHYIDNRAALERLTRRVFDALAAGAIKVDRIRSYPLEQAAEAHRDMEARVASGVPVLVP